WELYDKAGIAVADARGAVELAREEGEARGEVIGLRNGEMRNLLRLIRHRFGAVPEWVPDRLATADLKTLETWNEKILVAESLQAVFQ
ncbi:MAG: cytosolic protein, partial [Magnetococcales bacterium]|nr:cytosolic protein [Magnetococcales bacterium]